ncbi:hypothetical protein B0H21DRAFT_746382 [Amylocystis lapponica]|nr:hypothetical protein B0H21DRAFT_746382 [Amylocystis lapponica]
MAPSCVEIINVRATDAYRSNPVETILPAFQVFKDVPGNLKLYHGLQSGDPSSIFIVIVWDDLESHRRFQANPMYPIAREHLGNVRVPDPSKAGVWHVNTTNDPFEAFAAPLTEVTIIKLKPGQSKTIVETDLDAIVRAESELPQSWGLVNAFWGPTVEKEDVVIMFSGWTSHEAHQNIGTAPGMREITTHLAEFGECNVMTVPLTTFK